MEINENRQCQCNFFIIAFHSLPLDHKCFGMFWGSTSSITWGTPYIFIFCQKFNRPQPERKNVGPFNRHHRQDWKTFFYQWMAVLEPRGKGQAFISNSLQLKAEHADWFHQNEKSNKTLCVSFRHPHCHFSDTRLLRTSFKVCVHSRGLRPIGHTALK